MKFEQMYTTYKPLLLSIAYRMLGSISDAEDIVQDVFVSLQQTSLENVHHLKAYLAKITTNRCLNLLNSSRKQRELYPGPWLPEPDIQMIEHGPEDRIVMEEKVTYALLVLLQKLSPMERAVYVLREVLEFDYKDLSEMLGKSEVSCRKVMSRLKQKLDRDKAVEIAPTNGEQMQAFVQTFIQASRTGSFGAFIDLLIEDSTLLTDGGGKVRAALNPIYGSDRIQSFWEGIFIKGALEGEYRQVQINGEAGILLMQQGQLKWSVCFEMTDNLSAIRTIYMISNPEKLKHCR
ncbi:RNA polymerase sigma-70 factor, ECF subfamily [Paenibacillus sp. 1_12]|uniref:sigma-70 family RNA polymerase sigma factor n=1 Tax=Paenibacillus sp. 1_12 TaxID=1566278 RepID=UPI0008DFB124|nr:sigma-70 family RNA polymerase sigma factor [Paenibacillus sp. 1_12]SFL47436.1 RNA polymerase sigma-70 factor, ECF subfamily [Paenibacillus sp. 1_12]